MPKRFRSDEKNWVLVERRADNNEEEPIYETLNLNEVIDELQDLDELAVLGSETILTSNNNDDDGDDDGYKTTLSHRIDENEIELEDEEKNEARVEESSSSSSTISVEALVTEIASHQTKSKSVKLASTSSSTNTSLALHCWTQEERAAAEVVANLVAPGNFIGGSDCAIFALFDRAISTHTFARPLGTEEPKRVVTADSPQEKTEQLQNVSENKTTIQDSLYLSIKEQVNDRLKL
jgi:hypothetical protein